MRAADFLVTFGTELRDNQVAFLVEQKKSVRVFYDERVGPAHFLAVGRGGVQRFPEALAGVRLEAAQLAIAANAVNMAVLQEWRAHGGMEGVRVFFTDSLALPDGLGDG